MEKELKGISETVTQQRQTLRHGKRALDDMDLLKQNDSQRQKCKQI